MDSHKPQHATPCSDVLSEVYFYIDAECDADRVALIKQHLAECGDCLREYDIEQEVKALLARCCRGERAPETLKEKVRVRLRSVVTGS